MADDTVTVTGPRVGRFIYCLWIVGQGILLWLTLPALLTALLLWDWRFLVAAAGLLAAHPGVMGVGAGCLWGYAGLSAVHAGRDPSVSFRLGRVKRVKVGRDWARNGMACVVPYAVAGTDSLSKGRAVSFEAPDGETGSDRAVYAFLMWSGQDAATLATLLGAQGVNG